MNVTKALAGMCFALVLVAGCSPTDHRVIMRALTAQLANEYHACVPLGWNPVSVAGTYYPGRSVEYQDASWLPPLWIGSVGKDEVTGPQTRATYAVLNELVRVGMLIRRRTPLGFRYHLTPRAVPYYFASNDYGNNPDDVPYLCYSTMVPLRVTWNQPVHIERGADGSPVRVFRAGFEWRASPDASWADAMLRSHGVLLAPTQSPVVAKFVDWKGAWYIENIESPLAGRSTVVDGAAWPSVTPRP